MSGVRGKKGGKGGAGSTASEAPNTLQSRATARILEIVSHGECVGLANKDNPLQSVYFDGVVAQNPDLSYNYLGVTLEQRFGLPSQDPFVGFSNVESETGIPAADITYTTPRVISITTSNIDAVRVRIQINALSEQSDKGGIVGSHVAYKFQRRPAAGAWEDVYYEDLYDKATSAQQLSYRIDRPPTVGPSDNWDVRVIRLTPDATVVTVQNSIALAGATLITDSALQYADLAGVAISADSEQFGGNIPARAYDWVGMVLDVPSNYVPPAFNDPNNTSTRQYIGLWDGTFKRAWTDNPAWILWAMLVDKSWGLGRVIDPAQVDKWALYQIAQYCDEFVEDGYGLTEPRYSINTQINSAEEAYAMLQSIASTFRGMLYWGPGAVTFIADTPSDPVKLVTPANVINGEFNYQGASIKARHSVVRVTWNDPNDAFKAAIEVVEDAELLDRFGWRPKDVIAYGCTSRGQANRMARWVLDTERYETEVVNYQASFDHADVRPGDIVQIHDPHYAGVRLGGRSVAVTNTSLTLDAPITIESGQAYEVTIVRPDGTLVTRTVNNAVGASQSVLTWASSLLATPQVGGQLIVFNKSRPVQRAQIAEATATTILFWETVEIEAGVTYTVNISAPGGVQTLELVNTVTSGSEWIRGFDLVGTASYVASQGATAFVSVPDEGYQTFTITASTQNSVQISAGLDIQEGYAYELTIPLTDGSVITRHLTHVPEDAVLTLSWQENATTLPLVGSVWGVTASNVNPRLFRVIGVNESQPNIFDIAGLQYDPDKYARIEEGLILPPKTSSIYQSQQIPEPPIEIDAFRHPVLETDGTYTDWLMVRWQPSPSILVNRYKIAYQFNQGGWIEIGDSYSLQKDFLSNGPGEYTFRIIAVNFLNKESRAAIRSLTLEDVRPFEGARIRNIRIENSPNVTQPTTVEFTGSDLKIEWDVLAPLDWFQPDENNWEDPYLRRYQVDIKSYSLAGEILRATYYTTDRRYVLTKEQNTEAAGGAPLRNIRIKVSMEDTYGTVYPGTNQQFSNPPPAAPTVNATATANGFIINITQPAELDYSGTLVWVSTTSGFSPTLTTPMFKAPQTAFAMSAVAGTTYYVRAAHFDDYTVDPGSLNISSQVTISVPKLGTIDIADGAIGSGQLADGAVTSDKLNDSESIATPVGLALSSAYSLDTDGSQVVRVTATWTAVTDTKLSGYEISLAEGAGGYVEFPTSNASYTVVGKANTLYSAKVRSVTKTGAKSSYSSVVTATSTKDTVAPSTPTSVSATASFGAIYLSWTNPSDADLSGTEVWETTTGSAPDPVTDIANRIAVVNALPSTRGSFTRSGLGSGVTKYYWLRAVDTSSNVSSFTSSVNATTTTIGAGDVDTTPPDVPTGLTLSSNLTVDVDGTQVTTLVATWTGVTDPSSIVYEVDIEEASGSFIEYQTSLTRLELRVKSNILYTVKVRAVDPSGNKSSFTSDATHTTVKDTVAPSAPTSLSATGAFTNIWLTWTNPSDTDLKVVEVYENTTNSSGTATKIATVLASPGAQGRFTRSGLAVAYTAYYWLKAVDSSGNASSFTSSVTGTTTKIVGTEITDNTITTNLITVNSLNGDRIQAGTLDANKVAAGTVLAGTITVSGTALSTVVSNALNPGGVINAGSTTIDPGKVLISGGTTLANWRNGTDATKIEGGNIYANSISANSLKIGARGVTVRGVEFQANWDGTAFASNKLYWSTGVIEYINDSGTAISQALASNTLTWTTGTLYVYFTKGGTALSSTTTLATAMAADTIVLATYTGGTGLVATYGGTIIDGTKITTSTITASQIAVGTITATNLYIGSQDNLIPNPGSELAYTTGPGSAGLLVVSAGVAYSGTGVRRIINPSTGETSLIIARVPCSPGDSFYMEAMSKIISGTGNTGIYGYFVDSSGTSLGAGGVVQTTSNTTTSWALTTNTSVAPAASVELVIFIYHNTTAGTSYFDSLYARKMMTGRLVVNGSIITAHMTANTINADRIQGGTITGDKFLTSTSLPGTITVGVTGVSIGTIQTQAGNPATVVNAGSTTIDPGRILISGATTLASWRNGTDATKIEGGSIYANTIDVNKLKVGARGLSITGLEFSPSIAVNSLSWTAGSIWYTNDAGTATSAAISAGTTGAVGAVTYVYWVQGATSLSVTTTFSTANGANNVVLATYSGGGNYSATYGGTIIDGSRIVTASITATQIAAGTITATQIAATTITAAQIAATTITAAQIATGTITATQIAANTITTNKLSVGSNGNRLWGADSSPDPSLYVRLGANPNGAAMVTPTRTNVTNSAFAVEGAGFRLYQSNATYGASGTAFTEYYFYYPSDQAGTYSLYYPAEVGKAYEFSVYGGVLNCTAEVYIMFYNSTTFLGSFTSGQNSSKTGGSKLADFYRYVARGTAPTGTTRMICLVRKWNTSSGSDSYFFGVNPMLGETVVGATENLPWTAPGTTNIDGGSIITNTLNANRIVASSITATQIASGTITATQIATGTITATNIAGGSITADKLAASNITVALGVGAAGKIYLDGANNRIIVYD